MRNLLLLAAAASLAMACHSRTEDEVGAAPDQGDTTTVVADTAMGTPADTTMGQMPAETDTTFVTEDPGYVADDTTAFEPTTGADTVGAQGEVQTGDTTGVWTDTTEAAAPDDTTYEPTD